MDNWKNCTLETERMLNHAKRFFGAGLVVVVVLVILILLQFTKNISRDGTIIDVNRILSATKEVNLPSYIEENLIDKGSYLEFVRNHDHRMQTVTPFYWHVAKAGGTAVQTRYLTCFTLIAASEIGLKDHENEDFLRIVHANGSTNHINVDVSSLSGINRAQQLHLGTFLTSSRFFTFFI